MNSNLVSFILFGVFAVALSMPQTPKGNSEYNEKSCPRRCQEQYYPICGVNADGDNCVFVNDCYMSMENCNKPAEKVYHEADSEKCPEYSSWINENWNQNEANEV